ncbi:MAG: glycerol-3-phosphate 1-O-acyltransferase PlsY [candidate division Zixibacteria bacterium]|nr:glycerol-3-phosphate 1-O-acyltransferase PlsY [candidate division Zixibacteria bacterium]
MPISLLKFVIVIVLSYLLGSIPFGIIISRLFKGIDVREYGSKNIGFTNVFRVVGVLPAVIVLILDIGKGALSVLLISQIATSQAPLSSTLVRIAAGIFVILGHIFPIFANFKGGKGVATAAGVLLALVPSEFILVLVIFILVVSLTRYISLGSLVSSLFLPLILILEKCYLKKAIPIELIIVSLILCFLIFYTHRQNIKRLLRGTENKFGKKDKRI